MFTRATRCDSGGATTTHPPAVGLLDEEAPGRLEHHAVPALGQLGEQLLLVLDRSRSEEVRLQRPAAGSVAGDTRRVCGRQRGHAGGKVPACVLRFVVDVAKGGLVDTGIEHPEVIVAP